MKNEVVECSGCIRWVKADELDIVGMLQSDADKMKVFCVKCTHGMFSALRREMTERREDVKALREALVILYDQKGIRVSGTSSLTQSNAGKVGQGIPYAQVEVVRMPAIQSPSQGRDGFTVVNRRKKAKTEVQGQAVAVPGGTSQVQNTPRHASPETQIAEPPTVTVRQEGVFTDREKKGKPTINIIGDSMIQILN